MYFISATQCYWSKMLDVVSKSVRCLGQVLSVTLFIYLIS